MVATTNGTNVGIWQGKNTKIKLANILAEAASSKHFLMEDFDVATHFRMNKL